MSFRGQILAQIYFNHIKAILLIDKNLPVSPMLTTVRKNDSQRQVKQSF